MSTNKKVKNIIIQWFILNSIIILGFLFTFFIYVLPNFQEIETKKETLMEIFFKKQKILKEWIEFADFKKLSSSTLDKANKDSYESHIIKNINTDFYTNNFINKTEETYDKFIEIKDKEIIEKTNSQEYKKEIEKVRNILPTYSAIPALWWDLTDFRFINYIETLIYTFNLESNISSIGIWDVTSIKEKDSEEKKNLIESEIYYIPFQLKVVGQKKDILDFLHYINKVWTLDINDWKIDIYSDSLIKKTLEWERKTNTYNVYEHQIMDILDIKMEDYLDSSIEGSKEEEDMISLVRNNQAKEKFESDISLVFYIKWIPEYKIIELIDNIVKEHDNLSIEVNETIKQIRKNKDIKITWKYTISVRNINLVSETLNLLKKDIDKIKKTIYDPKIKKDVLYKQVLDYNRRLKNIRDILDKETQNLKSFLTSK